MITRFNYLLIVVITVLKLQCFESSSFISSEENPAEWAVKWNGIGRSNNPTHGYARSWKGIGISQAEKTALISKIESQPASEVYAGLLSRPSSKTSAYGTCRVGIVRGMPTFWVEGMYGSVGHSGYPKNPVSGDATGHLRGCYTEHNLTGLCSYSNVAERAKKTLLYAVENDVCTNYHNFTLVGEPTINNVTDSQSRAVIYLSSVGLKIPSTGTGEDKWITLCEVRAQVAHSRFKPKRDEQICTKIVDGEILEIRVIRHAERRCSIKTDIYGSGTLLKFQHILVNQYNDGIQVATDAEDRIAADYIESMKNQHIENLNMAANKDTAKLTAIAKSMSWWKGGGGANCDLVLEGRVRQLIS